MLGASVRTDNRRTAGGTQPDDTEQQALICELVHSALVANKDRVRYLVEQKKVPLRGVDRHTGYQAIHAAVKGRTSHRLDMVKELFMYARCWVVESVL